MPFLLSIEREKNGTRSHALRKWQSYCLHLAEVIFLLLLFQWKLIFPCEHKLWLKVFLLATWHTWKRKKKRIDLATNWENGRKSVVFFLQMDENIFINLEKKLNFQKGRKHSFLWVLRLRWYDWTRFFLQLIYFD